MGCLHDQANVQQTSSKCNAGRLLEVCWTVRLLPYVIMELNVCWKCAESLFGTFFVATRYIAIVRRTDGHFYAKSVLM